MTAPLHTGPAGLVKTVQSHIPEISPIGAMILLPLLTLGAFGLGFLAASESNSWALGAFAGVLVGLIALVLVIGFLVVRSNAKAMAPLFVTRHGATELRLAEQLLFDRMLSPKQVRFRIVKGELAPIEEGAAQRGQEAAEGLFRIGGTGPLNLLLDFESACLVEQNGTFRALHGPEVQLGAQDRYWGCVTLRMQKEVFDIGGVFTRDGVPLQVTGYAEYQIQQDARHLEKTSTHRGADDAVRRALLPQNEWRNKTRELLQWVVQGIARDRDLWDFYAVSPKPQVPEDMNVIGALGRAVVPGDLRFELQDRLKTQLNAECWRWGVEVTRVQVDEIKPPQAIVTAAQNSYSTWSERRAQLHEIEMLAESKNTLALMEAVTDKKKQALLAEGEAEAYNKMMHARAEGAQEFVRSVQDLKQVFGADRNNMHEVLMAFGMAPPPRRKDERLQRVEMYTRGPLGENEE